MPERTPTAAIAIAVGSGLNDAYPLDAVAAVTDLFNGQPQGAPEYTVIELGNWDDDGLFTRPSPFRIGRRQ